MGIIHHTPKEPIHIKIEDISVPVEETSKLNTLFKDLFDAEAVTKVPRVDIIAACASKKSVNGYTFELPDLPTIVKAFPNYRVVHHPLATHQARPTTVHTLTPGKFGKKVDIDFETMSGVQIVYDMSRAAFEAIRNHTNGYKRLLPPCVTGITVQAPGWKPPKSRQFVAPRTARTGPNPALFECRQLKSSIAIAYVGPASVATIRDVPGFVLANSIWK